jgi:flagellar biosynthesis/type III secretory pathway protein FliH
MTGRKPDDVQRLSTGNEAQAPAFDGEVVPTLDETEGTERAKIELINTWQTPVIKAVEPKEKPEVDDTQHQVVLNALTKKRGYQRTSLMFKHGEIQTNDFQWSEIDVQPSEQELAEAVTDLFEGLISGDASEMALGLMEGEKPISREVLERARNLADEQTRQAVDQARTKAEQIIQQTRQEAEGLIAQANREYAGIVQQARQEGMEAAKKEAIPILQAARTVVEQTQKWHEYVLSQSESTVLGLVKEIAQRLLGTGMILEADTLGQLFAEAVAEAKPLGALRIRLNPADIEVLGPLWAEQQAALTGQEIEFSPSNNILRGGCLIEGEFGILDAQVNTKLQRVMDTLAEVENQPVEVPQEEEALAELPVEQEQSPEITQVEEQVDVPVDADEQLINPVQMDEQPAVAPTSGSTEQPTDIIDLAEQAIQSIETTRQSTELSDMEARIFGSGGQT